MKKRVIQWLIGFGFALWGLAICMCGVGTVLNFISMINSIGSESTGWFVLFVLTLLAFVFSPYLFFKVLEDGVRDKFK